MQHAASQALFDTARELIPGGVNSPVRAFKGVGGQPIFMQRAQGAYLYDVDGNRYIDYIGSWGPMIAGHNPPAVLEAVQRAVSQAMSFGTPCEAEVAMAARVRELVPSMEMIRMVNSGTEACMSAVRLARGFTGRDRIIKFEGCYHGHADAFLVAAGSGAATLGVPNSPGVPDAVAELTLTLPYNDLDALDEVLSRLGSEVACLIVEPVAGNMNLIEPLPGYLAGLRERCDAHGIVLIFDEVMTGFRVAAGGAQALYGVRPDLSTFGKVIGGGMPVGAFGGRADIMAQLAPSGPVYQAGTLSGNPVAMAAGLANLELLSRPGFFEALGKTTAGLVAGLLEAAGEVGVPLAGKSIGGMFGIVFTQGDYPDNFAQISAADLDRYGRFFHQMLERGIYLAPSAYEAGFVSAAHTAEDIEATLSAARQAFELVA